MDQAAGAKRVLERPANKSEQAAQRASHCGGKPNLKVGLSRFFDKATVCPETGIFFPKHDT